MGRPGRRPPPRRVRVGTVTVRRIGSLAPSAPPLHTPGDRRPHTGPDLVLVVVPPHALRPEGVAPRTAVGDDVHPPADRIRGVLRPNTPSLTHTQVHARTLHPTHVLRLTPEYTPRSFIRVSAHTLHTPYTLERLKSLMTDRHHNRHRPVGRPQP